MTDLTPILNELLKNHDARPTANPTLSLKNIDEFLKEAYRIVSVTFRGREICSHSKNSHIASLNNYLKAIRQSYLSTAPPPRRTYTTAKTWQWKYLTNREREEIDAEAKQLLRELNVSIRNFADAEQLRQNTETTVIRKKYTRLGLGALGSWAAGGAGHTKSYEQEQDEAKAGTIVMHRESVLWYLRQKLQECGRFQGSIMETRLLREMEKNRSVLANSRGGSITDFDFNEDAKLPAKYMRSSVAHIEAPVFNPEEELTPEQIQIFEKENQDMLKHYESTLDQVRLVNIEDFMGIKADHSIRTAERSLVEISELQTQLVNNLVVQSEHIDQLVADSFLTAENVGGGNRQLKKAAERKSTAKYVFYTSCGLSAFLIVWDLVI
jgi:syntaxin 18